jgi:GxxExxY protein
VKTPPAADDAEDHVAVVVGCGQLVLRRLGPARPRPAYVRALVDELTGRRFPFQVGAKLPLFRHGVRLDAHELIELCVFGRVIVDVVACDQIRAEHCMDLRRRLHSTGSVIGVIVNFASARLVLGRVVVRRVGAFCLSGRTVNIEWQTREGCRVNPPC